MLIRNRTEATPVLEHRLEQVRRQVILDRLNTSGSPERV